MPPSPPTEALDSHFVCDCADRVRPACKGLPFFKVHDGKLYCVLHYPGKEKSVEFAIALKRKLAGNEFDFRGVWFPAEQEFANLHFGSDADFSLATFSESVIFRHTTFRGAARFREVTFSAKVDFHRVGFWSDADFSYTTFNAEAYFALVTFMKRANFNAVTVRDYFKILGGERWERYVEKRLPVFEETATLELQFPKIEKPELASFYLLSLRPHWFVNVDPRKFEFTNVRWYWRSTKKEIESLSDNRVRSPHGMLSVTCRRLAVNAEENHHYEDASRLRYMSMEAQRLEYLFGFSPWRLGWWYWLASGYGERVLRAFVVLIAIWWGFSFIYFRAQCTDGPLLGGQVCVEWERKEGAPSPPESFTRSLAYTLNVMSLQTPEPRPASPAAQMLVTLCTILGPVQGALLALAIRRKFMR